MAAEGGLALKLRNAAAKVGEGSFPVGHPTGGGVAATESGPSAAAPASQVLLEVQDLRAGYGKKEVLHGISLQLAKGEVACLLGHNGAGKSTTMRTIVGGVRNSAGHILFEGQDIGRRSVADRLRLGIAYVEPRGILPGLTVKENLALAQNVLSRHRSGASAHDALDLFPDLRPRLRHRAGALSGGQRQMLALAMAIIGSPSLLMLDEPLLGLAPRLAQGLLKVIRNILGELGASMLLVEQNVKAALELSEWTYILRAGELSAPLFSDQVLREGDFWSII